jgi:N-hydroxyarylamine O-acetyltransferase
MPEVDPKAYFARIGYTGPKTATLATLQALHRLHPVAIPFENLDPLLKRPVDLALSAIFSKLVEGGRGGYCYEQNTLFAAVLETLGYCVSTVAARVQWGTPATVQRPRSHMLLRIKLPQQDYLADVGFGLLTLTAPLRLQPDVEQTTPHGRHRLLRIGDELQLQVRLLEAWAPMYQLSLQEQAQSDWEVANWFTSTHPNSAFTHSLMAARPVGDQRYGLLNNRLSIYHSTGRVERRFLQTCSQLASVLKDDFRLRLPQGTEHVLARLVSPPSQPRSAD